MNEFPRRALRRAPAIAALACLGFAADAEAAYLTLSSGAGDNSATFITDQFGRMSFGTYDPFGVVGGAAHSAGDDVLLFHRFGESDAFKARLESGSAPSNGGWASALNGTILADQMDRNVTAATSDSGLIGGGALRTSSFGFDAPGHALGAVTVELTQSVVTFADGVLLRRSYVFTNSGDATLALDMVVASDVDLDFASFANNRGDHTGTYPGSSLYPSSVTLLGDGGAVGATQSVTGAFGGYAVVTGGGILNQGVYTDGPLPGNRLNDMFLKTPITSDGREGWSTTAFTDNDVNGDGVSDTVGDMMTILQSTVTVGGHASATWTYDYYVFSTPPAAPVPEPGTLALGALGLAGLGVARRRG